MTIAVCYVSPEGVVFGADSTTTFGAHAAPHYFDHAQKLLEIGQGSSLGFVTWGLGGLGHVSYRTLLARLADDLAANPPASVLHVANRWANMFWPEFEQESRVEIDLCRALGAKRPHDPAAPAADDMRTAEEEQQFHAARNAVFVGFCIGGYVAPDRQPIAYVLTFDALSSGPGEPQPITSGFRFWGAPNIIERIFFGCDAWFRKDLLDSGKWSGTADELDDLIDRQRISHPSRMPVREAVDFVYTCILTTIKGLKFSSYSQICGGPIEIAVVTADRPFRWVRHKPWDSAILEGENVWSS